MQSKADPVFLTDDSGAYGTPGDLTPWDIRFDPANRAFLDTDPDGSARFRVWTDPSLSDGLLVVRTSREVVSLPMRVAAGTLRFLFWEVLLPPPLDPGAEFTFAFKAPNGRGVYRVPSGIANGVERLDRWPLDPPETFSVPDWARGAVIYQVFPDRFARAGGEAPLGLLPWGSPPDSWGFQGGDLAGITGRLGYLSDLGVEAIYMNPIFQSPSNHRYDTIDYYTVDPLLGDNDDLGTLVEEAHRRSIRVILDASFNHVHPRFFAFADVVEKGPDSDYWDWFIVEDWPLRIEVRDDLIAGDPYMAAYVEHLRGELGFEMVSTGTAAKAVSPSYEAWYGVPTMPRVDLSNPEARSYMLDVAAHWPREYGTDGWRMDVVRYVDRDFWNDFRDIVRAVRPDAYLLSEVMGDTSWWLQGDRFDATMNYTFRDLCVRFFAEEAIAAPGMLDGLSRAWALYAWPVTLANQNLIGSHDTERFLTLAGGEVWRLRLATILQMTYPGAPGIYYGDEVAMEGGDDPESRGAFLWDDDPTEHEVHATIRELAALRRKEPALVTGEWSPLHGEGGSIVFERRLDGRRLVVAINRGEEDAAVDVDVAGTKLWGHGQVEPGHLVVPPRSALVAV